MTIQTPDNPNATFVADLSIFTTIGGEGYGENKPESPSRAYGNMSQSWPLLHALLGGTRAMKAGGVQWLAQEPKEEPINYKVRLSRCVLFEAYKSVVDRICAKPFSKEVSTKGELPPQLDGFIDNVDRLGTDLTDFGKKLMYDATVHGLTHVLVDFPSTGGQQTYEDERFGSAKPFFRHLTPVQIIGWKTSQDPVTGQEILTQLRIQETVLEDDGDFGQTESRSIRVINTDDFQIYEQLEEGGEYLLNTEKSGTISNPFNFVPLVSIYFNQTGFMTGEPPLENIAQLNLTHWQSTADHRNYLRFCRIATIKAFGFNKKEIDAGIVISPNSVTSSVNEGAKLEFLEHSGKAYEAGVKDLQLIQDQMEILGLKPLVAGSAKSTAAGKIIDENNQDSQCQAWIRSLESGLVAAFDLAHQWLGLTMSDDFEIDVFNDFKVTSIGSDDVDKLLKMRESIPPQISHETFINETRRRGLLSEEINSVDEMEAITKELNGLLDEGVDEDVDE